MLLCGVIILLDRASLSFEVYTTAHNTHDAVRSYENNLINCYKQIVGFFSVCLIVDKRESFLQYVNINTKAL